MRQYLYMQNQKQKFEEEEKEKNDPEGSEISDGEIEQKQEKENQAEDSPNNQNTTNHEQIEDQYPELLHQIQSNQFTQPKLQEQTSSTQQKDLIASKKISIKHQLQPIIVCDEQQTGMFPSTYLEPSPKGFKPLKIKIQTYKKTMFMKIQTQVFNVDVINQSGHEQYIIERRFSDFVDLYQSIFYNQPGYILHPFPGKNLESFIKIKLGIGSMDSGHRTQMIEKRMQQLQTFTNYLTHHQQLSNCEQLKIFLMKDQTQFEENKKRTQKYVEEYKSLEKVPEIKYLFQKGLELFKSYVQKQKEEEVVCSEEEKEISHRVMEFMKIYTILRDTKNKAEEFTKLIEELYRIQKKYSEFRDMETQIDILLKVCAKHSSSQQFHKKLMDIIQIKILQHLRKDNKYLQQIEKSLMYRLEIIEVMKIAQQKNNQEKFSKLQRRLERFERNFIGDWQAIISKLQKNYNSLQEQILEAWQSHKQFMRKIWKFK